MKEIPLTRGLVALVDDSDFEELNRWKWFEDGRGYARRGEKRSGKLVAIFMHRVLLGADVGDLVDHIDGNGLNNTRANLRLCNHFQNMRNSKMRKNNTSGFKGVFWDKKNENWRARIRAGAGMINIGSFDTPEEAARHYDAAALRYHGEFARPNSI